MEAEKSPTFVSEDSEGSRTGGDVEAGSIPISSEKVDEALQVEAFEPPEGGRDAWLVVLGAWCCAFSALGWVSSVGSFQQYYKIGPLSNYSDATIAWIPSLEIFLVWGLGPVVGALFDKYGPRPLIIGGTLFHVFGVMMISLSTTYYQFILSQGVCSAMGICAIYQPALACVQTWFAKKRGTALGVLTSGASIGGIVFPIIVSKMLPEVGFPWTIRTMGFIILGLQIIAILTVRMKSKPPAEQRIPAGRRVAPFKELPFVLLMFGIIIINFGTFAPVQYLAAEGYQKAHVSEGLAQYLVAIFNAATVPGRIVTGILADRFGRWNVFVVACIITGVVTLAMWIPTTTPGIAIGFAALFGFSTAAFIGLSGSLPVSVSPPEEIGYRMGIFYFALAISSLVVGPIAGAILELKTSWLGVEIFSGVMAIAGSLIVLVARLFYTDKKLFKIF